MKTVEKAFNEYIRIIKQEVRKQVCDEIRKKSYGIGEYRIDINTLDQIEKGE